MKILVTGGSGYIGSALIPLLLNFGDRVIVVDKTVPLHHNEVKFIQQDFLNPKVWCDELIDAIRTSDIIVHLAATFDKDHETSRYINYVVTGQLFELCMERETNIERFVFVSTCGVLHDNDNTEYTMWKRESEKHIQKFKSMKVPWVIVRLASVFGKAQQMNYNTLVNGLIRDAKGKNRIEIFGGNEYRPFVHIDTAAMAIYRAIWRYPEKVAFRTVNVATENRTKQDIANIIAKHIPDIEILSTESNKRGYTIDNQEIFNVFNINKHKSLDVGIREMLQEYER